MTPVALDEILTSSGNNTGLIRLTKWVSEIATSSNQKKRLGSSAMTEQQKIQIPLAPFLKGELLFPLAPSWGMNEQGHRLHFSLRT